MWRRKKIIMQQVEQAIQPSFEFNHAMAFAKKGCSHAETTQEKLTLLDYILDAVREDLKTDLIGSVLYRSENLNRFLDYPILPYYYVDEQGTKHRWHAEEVGERTVSLATDCVLTLPWKQRRLIDAVIASAKEAFQYDPKNQKAYYYHPLGVCYIHNGKHSIAAGMFHKKGTIQALEYDITALFPHVTTNGDHWLNAHTGEILELDVMEPQKKVVDFRVAVLYEVARMKWSLLRER